ncbi:MAG: hypothetical protein Q9191_007012 [Dirinaria sp. TL-2023a]
MPHAQLPWRCVECWNKTSIASKRSCPASDSNLNPAKSRRVGSESTFWYETFLSQTPITLGVHKLETRNLALEQRVKDLERQILDELQATKRKDETIVALEHEIRQQEAELVIKLNEQLAAREAEHKEILKAKDSAVAQLERAVQADDKTIQECNTALKKNGQLSNDLLTKRIGDLEKDALKKAEENQHLHTKLASFEEGLIMLQNAVRRESSNLSERDSTDWNQFN